MNNLDNSLELLTIAAAQYASEDTIVDKGITIIEALVDGYYNEQIKILLSCGYDNLLDAICSSVGDYNLTLHKQDVIVDILKYSRWELLVRVMQREPYRKAVRQVLYRMNKHQDTYRAINSKTKFEPVYFKFVEWFSKYSIGAYTQEAFTGFVKKAFENFYYKQFKKDIWATLREVDFAHKEADMKQSLSIQKLKVIEKSDVYINPLLTNIYVANRLLFKHSGHTLNTIVYDIFHLIINYRINKYLNEVNKYFTTFSIQLIDTGLPTEDAKELGMSSIPKGAFSKISNAKDMIPKLYEYIASRKLNSLFIGDLRDYAFTLGKMATSDSNCIWNLDDLTKETQFYLDDGKAIANYANFEIVMKGVLSAYTLIECIEARGFSVVDLYDPNYFKNINLIRSLDYLSSLQYKDLIQKLQNEDVPNSKNDYLGTFDDLVYLRAGSAENNRMDNRERREKAYTFGMLKNPALKQNKVETPFDTLKSIYMQMTSIPKTILIYNEICSINNYNHKNTVEFPAEIIGSHLLQNTLSYNTFLNDKELLTLNYLRNFEKKDTTFFFYFTSLDMSQIETLLFFEGNYYQLDADSNCFNLMGNPINLSDIKQMINESNGNTDFELIERPLVIEKSISIFPLLLGIHFSFSHDHFQMLDKVFSRFKNTSFIGKQYVYNILALSTMQSDFIDILTKLNEFSKTAITSGATQIVCDFVDQFIRKEFKTDVLNEFIEVAYSTLGCDIIELNESELISSTELSIMEKLILGPFIVEDYKTFSFDLITNSDITDNIKNTYLEFLNLINIDISPSSIFVLLYNYLSLSISFHIRLRDSFEMLFMVPNIEITSLMCELSTRYGLLDWHIKFMDYLDFGFALDTIQNKDIISIMRENCKLLFAKYKYCLNTYNDYLNSCPLVYTDLVNYVITNNPTSKHDFKAYGKLFNKTRNKNIPALDKLRQMYICDANGFFMRNGEYLKSSYNDYEYYIHRTGNLLLISGDSYKPIPYNEYTKDNKENEFMNILINSLSY